MDYKLFSGLCPDDSCQAKLYFPTHKTVIECPNCGQRHSQVSLGDITEVTDYEEAIAQVIKSLVYDIRAPKKESDTVKVHGLSNYLCKLISPFFTKYGMDKEGNPRLLAELGHGEMADCGRLLGHRAFLIAPEHVEITGYGRDQSGSVQYLGGLLDIIKSFHGGEEVLIPIHADGDGHCLVHALSRAVTGREIFWHALRENLVDHLETNLGTYKRLFREFIEEDDWKLIIDEADPYHTSPEGFSVGLGNIHIFALANVLRRPIVLMDSLEGVKNVADYAGIFIPALIEPSRCRDHLPLCVAWSGLGHNHFIPLVGVAGKPLPSIPQPLIPNVWGVDKTVGERYLNFNDDGSLTVAGGKPLQKGYLLRLVSAMEKVFLEHHSVAAKLVADMHLYVYKRVGFVGLHPDVATERTRDALRHGKIFRCLVCNALSVANVDAEDLEPGGCLFKLVTSIHGRPRSDVVYNLPTHGLQCKYDSKKQCLVPFQFDCRWCGVKSLRRVDQFGNPLYENGDTTKTPAEIPGQCCGSKHYWDGAEYENVPKQFSLKVTLQGKMIEEKITWFFGDSNPALNSDSSELVKSIVEKHFEADDPDFEEHERKILAALRSYLIEYGLSDEPFTGLSGGSEHQSEVARRNNLKTDTLKRSKSSKAQLRTDAVSLKASFATSRDVPSTSKSSEKKRTVSQRPFVDIATKLDSKEPAASTASNKTVKIRISTSDGRQETLNIDKDLSYTGLLNIVQKDFGIVPIRQVLKLGFPPKMLEVADGKSALGLRNGDRVTVEIKRDFKPSEGSKKPMRVGDWPKKELRRSSAEDEALHDFVGGLQRTSEYGGPKRSLARSSESVDAALAAVVEMAKMIDETVWSYTVRHPELFRPGGAFYDQFSRDVGLVTGRHCMLPLLPGRTFRYNAENDEVDLCLEPVGHFAVNSEVIKVIEQITSETDTDANIEFEAPSLQQLENNEIQNAKLGEENEPTKGEEDDRAAASSAEVATELEQADKMEVSGVDGDVGNDATAEGELEGPAEKESRLAPGIQALGREPAAMTDEEVDRKRRHILRVLKSIKESGDR